MCIYVVSMMLIPARPDYDITPPNAARIMFSKLYMGM